MNSNKLPEFKSFLLSNSLVSEKYITFYAHWASKFLTFSNGNEHLNVDLRIREFLNYLRTQNNISDWQIRQANEAIQLYTVHFLQGNTSSLSPNLPERKYRHTNPSQDAGGDPHQALFLQNRAVVS